LTDGTILIVGAEIKSADLHTELGYISDDSKAWKSRENWIRVKNVLSGVGTPSRKSLPQSDSRAICTWVLFHVPNGRARARRRF
jgi:hypothetical protein